MKTRPLWRHLWLWAVSSLVLVWAVQLAVAYKTGLDETHDITDGQLISMAQWVATTLPSDDSAAPASPLASAKKAPLAAPEPTARELSLREQGYLPEWAVLAGTPGSWSIDSHGLGSAWESFWAEQSPGKDLQTWSPGHHTVRLEAADTGASAWRAYALQIPASGARPARWALVLLRLDHQQNLAHDMAVNLIGPVLWVWPAVVLVLAWAIRRGLYPLKRLGDRVAALDVRSPARLPQDERFSELARTVNAFNSLLTRLQGQTQHERQFAADVAHELRTPLTALLVQARLAQTTVDARARGQALDEVAQGALKAGRILSQLLALARSQGVQAGDGHWIDAVALGQRLVAEHAPTAYASGHEIEYTGQTQAVKVWAQALMLELAWRNVIDNALRHTPAGTQVQVAVERVGQGVQMLVRNSGPVHPPEACGATGRPASNLAEEAGLGLGLKLVQRIADWHGWRWRVQLHTGPWARECVLEVLPPSSPLETPVSKRVF